MDQRSLSTPARCEAFSQHADDRIKVGAGEFAEGPRSPHAIVQRRLGPVLCRDLGHDLLGEHVGRLVWNDEPIELATTNAVEQCGTLHEVVPREREQPAFRSTTDRVPRASNALQKARNRTRGAELADEVYVADIDTEFERSGGNEGFQLAVLELLFCSEPVLLRHASVMSGDGPVRDSLREFVSDALRHFSGVDEDKGRAVCPDQIDQAIVDLLPDLVRHHRLER